MNTPRDAATSSSACRVTPSILTGLTKWFKLRVVALLLLAAVAGAFLGAGGWPGIGPLLLLIFTGGLAAAGASAINQYLERESDSQMSRTGDRPLVTGAIAQSAWIPVAGVLCIVLPAVIVLPFNPALALWVTSGAVIYLGVYTLWLKPRTPLNVVIGGAAGSCAVLSGGAAVGSWSDPGVLGLALLLFLWSPTHFWSLALACRDDYARIHVPMLPVVSTPRRAALWNLAHAVGSGIIGLMLVFRPTLGLYYFLPVLAATALLWTQGIRLLIDPSEHRAWRLFYASNFYLGLLLLTVCLVALFR